MLVASGRGVAVMPDWVLRAQAANPEIALLPLGRNGILRRLYAALRYGPTGSPADVRQLQWRVGRFRVRTPR